MIPHNCPSGRESETLLFRMCLPYLTLREFHFFGSHRPHTKQPSFTRTPQEHGHLVRVRDLDQLLDEHRAYSRDYIVWCNYQIPLEFISSRITSLTQSQIHPTPPLRSSFPRSDRCSLFHSSSAMSGNDKEQLFGSACLRTLFTWHQSVESSNSEIVWVAMTYAAIISGDNECRQHADNSA